MFEQPVSTELLELTNRVRADRDRRYGVLRETIQEGYNILLGTGDTFRSAMKKLVEEVREVQKTYKVDFIAGLNLKEDGKNIYHAAREANLMRKGGA